MPIAGREPGQTFAAEHAVVPSREAIMLDDQRPVMQQVNDVDDPSAPTTGGLPGWPTVVSAGSLHAQHVRRSTIEAAERLDAVACVHLASTSQAERASRVTVGGAPDDGLVARV